MFKLMNTNNDDGFGMETCVSLKKVITNPSAVSNITSLNTPNSNSILLGMIKQKSIRNLPSVSNKEEPTFKPQSFIKPTTVNIQKTTESFNIKKK